jgi:hypothetical protein
MAVNTLALRLTLVVTFQRLQHGPPRGQVGRIAILGVELSDMANAAELTTQVARLEERVANHIKFFWGAVAAGFLWLSLLSLLLYHINDTANRIATNQATDINALSIRENLTEYAIAKPDDLKNDLPKVDSNLQAARKHKVKVAPPVLSNLQAKLSAMEPSTAEYWPVAAQFISYRSQVNIGTAFQTLSRPDMPNCTDNPPTPMEYHMTAEEEKSLKDSARPNPNQFIPALYENCRFVLDSPEEAARVPYARDGRAFFIKFKNCQIIYNGGVIALFNPHPGPSAVQGKGPTRGDIYLIGGQQIDFENCLFLFSIKTIPPQDGQSLTRELLAQSGPVFSFGKIKIG